MLIERACTNSLLQRGRQSHVPSALEHKGKKSYHIDNDKDLVSLGTEMVTCQQQSKRSGFRQNVNQHHLYVKTKQKGSRDAKNQGHVVR